MDPIKRKPGRPKGTFRAPKTDAQARRLAGLGRPRGRPKSIGGATVYVTLPACEAWIVAELVRRSPHRTNGAAVIRDCLDRYLRNCGDPLGKSWPGTGKPRVHSVYVPADLINTAIVASDAAEITIPELIRRAIGAVHSLSPVARFARGVTTTIPCRSPSRNKKNMSQP